MLKFTFLCVVFFYINQTSNHVMRNRFPLYVNTRVVMTPYVYAQNQKTNPQPNNSNRYQNVFNSVYLSRTPPIVQQTQTLVNNSQSNPIVYSVQSSNADVNGYNPNLLFSNARNQNSNLFRNPNPLTNQYPNNYYLPNFQQPLNSTTSPNLLVNQQQQSLQNYMMRRNLFNKFEDSSNLGRLTRFNPSSNNSSFINSLRRRRSGSLGPLSATLNPASNTILPLNNTLISFTPQIPRGTTVSTLSSPESNVPTLSSSRSTVSIQNPPEPNVSIQNPPEPNVPTLSLPGSTVPTTPSKNPSSKKPKTNQAKPPCPHDRSGENNNCGNEK